MLKVLKLVGNAGYKAALAEFQSKRQTLVEQYAKVRDIKFAPYLQAIKELNIDGVVSIELEYAPDPAKIVEWVEEAYRETEKLMRLAGMRD